MSEEPISSDKYEGPSQWAAALGEGKIFGWMGSIVGAVAGTVSSSMIVKEDGKWSQKIAKRLAEQNINMKGSGAIMIIGAVMGSVVGHYAGVVGGAMRGWDKAQRGQKQFEQIKNERDAARAEVSMLEKKFAEREEYKTNEPPHR